MDAILLMDLFIAPVVVGIVFTLRSLGEDKGALLLVSITFLLAYIRNELLFILFLPTLALVGTLKIVEILLYST